MENGSVRIKSKLPEYSLGYCFLNHSYAFVHQNMKILLTGLHITPYSQPIHPLSGNKLTSIIPKKDAILFKFGVYELTS